MAKGPGGEFEAEIHRSIPKRSRGGRPLSVEKRADPPGELVKMAAATAKKEGGSSFTPKVPYDFEIIVPAALLAPDGSGGHVFAKLPTVGPAPAIVFAFECKRTADPRLAFDAVKKHQRKGLLRIASVGGVAGVLWLYENKRNVGAPSTYDFGECHAIAIGDLVAYEASVSRKSLPITAAREIGIGIEVEVGRGRTRRYWKISALLRRFGADT